MPPAEMILMVAAVASAEKFSIYKYIESLLFDVIHVKAGQEKSH